MADYQYLDDTGVIVPDTATLQSEVEQEYKDAFGQDLIVTANTPQGILITAETTARANILRNNAALANQINPNLAGGVFLDAIWALTGGQRIAATRTVVPDVSLVGLPGTVIPLGSQASIADGSLFETTLAVNLDGDGLGTVDFQAVEFGPIAVEVGALDTIVSAIFGWDEVDNTIAGEVGQLEESDIAARLRRRSTISLQNVALPLAITSGLYDTEGVKSLAFRENYTDATAVINGITLVEHSVWACVDGGTNAAVAATLLANKSLGANWNGAVSVAVVDSSSGQTYTVKFDRPTPVPVIARVTVRAGTSLVDVTSAVRQSIIDYATGLLSEDAGLIVGASVSPFEFAGAVNRENPGIYVQKCEVSLASPIVWVTVEIAMALNQIATILYGDIQVIVL